MGASNPSAVVILHNGRILAEQYWQLENPPRSYANVVTGTDYAGRVIEDVASAQKSVVAILVGIAQQRAYLNNEHRVSAQLGAD